MSNYRNRYAAAIVFLLVTLCGMLAGSAIQRKFLHHMSHRPSHQILLL